MLTTLNNVRLLLLAAWLGAAMFFSGAVAPSAFRVLRSFSLPNAGEIAGTIVSQTLSVINIAGFIIALLLLASTVALKRIYPRPRLILQLVGLALMAVSTGLGEWFIAAKMRGLRQAMRGGIDQIALTDLGRVAFDSFHGYSVAALSVAIIAGLITFFPMAGRVQRNDQ